MHTSPKFCIFGAGAIGGTIAALLTRCRATVSVVARGQTLAALNRNGLRIMIDGETLQAPIQASEDPAELGAQDYDHHGEGAFTARYCAADWPVAWP